MRFLQSSTPSKSLRRNARAFSYPWQDLDVGKGFFVPDENGKKPMRGNQLGQTGNQWAKRQNVAARFQSFRYTLDGSDGVFVQRVA